MTTKKPEKLQDNDLDQAKGGYSSTNVFVQASVKQDPPKPDQNGFIPSAGTSRMD